MHMMKDTISPPNLLINRKAGRWRAATAQVMHATCLPANFDFAVTSTYGLRHR